MRKDKKREAKWQEEWIVPKVVIGVDQSYSRTGIAVAINGKLKKVTYIKFKSGDCKTDKRRTVSETIDKACQAALKIAAPNEIIIIVERIRTFSTPTPLTGEVAFSSSHPMLSAAYITSIGALTACIVDSALKYGIKTYSVDTRSWKSKVLGSSKPEYIPFKGTKNPQKVASIKNIIRLGFEEEITLRGHNRKFVSYNDDAADAANISLYGFFPIKDIKLVLET